MQQQSINHHPEHSHTTAPPKPSNHQQQQQHQEQQEDYALLLPSQLPHLTSGIDDFTILTRKLRFLSKNTLTLSRYCYEQQEKLTEKQKQIDQYSRKYQQIKSENTQLVYKIEQLTQKGEVLEKEESQKEPTCDQSTFQQARMKNQDSGKGQLEQENQRLKKDNQILEGVIRERDNFIKEKDLEIEQLRQNIRKLKETFVQQQSSRKTQEQLLQQKNQLLQQKNQLQQTLKEALEKVQDLTVKFGIVKQEKMQYQKELRGIKNSRASITAELELTNFSKEEQFLVLKDQLAIKSEMLTELQQKYKKLRHNYQYNKNQSRYIRERLQSMQSDQIQIEHIIIDRFVQAMDIYWQKIKEGNIKNQVQQLGSKKKAIFKRLEVEYSQLVSKKLIH